MTNLENEEKRLGETQNKLKKLLDTVNTDLDRERAISMDSSLNEKRILQEKEELLKTERELYELENKSLENLKFNKEKLNKKKSKLYELIDLIEDFVEKNEPISKNLLNDLKSIIEDITLSQEDYATSYGKNETIKGDSIKRKERIKNIDLELENWKNLKINSDKMVAELNNRKEKIQSEINENQESPQKIATQKGQNIQNLENTKKRNDELAEELVVAEKKYNLINQNIKEINEKLSSLRENKARNEATIEGIENRKKDLAYSMKNELGIENENILLSISDLNEVSENDFPSAEEQQEKIIKIKKDREALGSVNLRADEETKKYEDEIKKMESDRDDLYSAIVKLRTSIDELNQRGRERMLEAFEKINRKFNDVYTKLFSGGSAKLELVDSEDPLDAGLEMLVSPPGKRLQSISLLSGGEQALTALSLIFAVFLVNPSPICVLDEVDAPLDDANVTRFCSLLDELTKITQTKFIIITHHALTMSKMHRLYGITMPEKGISQLVAVDLQKAENLVA